VSDQDADTGAVWFYHSHRGFSPVIGIALILVNRFNGLFVVQEETVLNG
jgi:hypothetical protein